VTATVGPPLPPAERRRLIAVGLVRGLSVMIALTVLYYISPLDHLSWVPLWLSVTVGLLTLTAVTAYQVRAIIRAPHPAARAIGGIMITVPLFLFLFAATYFLMSQADAANFNVPGLTRTDALYFTVTVFATVGFGDITATSQTARVFVTVQMILGLILLGAGVRVFMGAVRLARQHPTSQDTDAS
jgi:voltage-gated potassium channel